MTSNKIFSLCIFFSFSSFASEIIKLDVGGSNFTTSRSTLCQYPDSMLAKMFDPDSKYRKDENSPFLDDDPHAFARILFYLRYKQWDFETVEQAQRTLGVADKLCHPLVEDINDWIKNHNNENPILSILRELSRNAKKELTPMLRSTKNKEQKWFLCNSANRRIIGNKDYGFRLKCNIDKLANEYNNRKVFPQFAYSLTGHGFGIYNIENNELIGETCDNWENISDLEDLNLFLKLDLINKAVCSNNEEIYLCAFNDKGQFSIFNSRTNEKMLSAKSFRKINQCLDALRENFS